MRVLATTDNCSSGAMKIKVLVHAKADIDKATTDNGLTPCFMAAQHGHTDLLQVLMHAKADPDKPTADDGRTPAFVAARNGHAESLRVLVHAGADVTRCLDGNGWCPLLVASGAGHLEVVRLSLNRAPQMVHVRTAAECQCWGQCIAAGSAPVDVARQLRRDEVAQMLAAKMGSDGGRPERLLK